VTTGYFRHEHHSLWRRARHPQRLLHGLVATAVFVGLVLFAIYQSPELTRGTD
jgi:hypothetical protein